MIPCHDDRLEGSDEFLVIDKEVRVIYILQEANQRNGLKSFVAAKFALLPAQTLLSK